MLDGERATGRGGGPVRRLTMVLHRRMGVALCLWIVLQAITGILLVHRHTLERLVQPGTFRVADPAPMDHDRVVAAVRAAFPDAELVRLRLPRLPDEAAVATLRAGGDTLFASLHPGDGRVLTAGGFAAFPFEGLYRLHRDVLVGTPGLVFVGVGGAVLLGMAATGMVQAWPRTSGAAKRLLKPRLSGGGRPAVGNLHRSGGMAAAILIAIAALSGIGLTLEEPMAAAIAAQYPAAPPSSVALPPDCPAAHAGIAAAAARSACVTGDAPLKEIRFEPGDTLHFIHWAPDAGRPKLRHHLWTGAAPDAPIRVRMAADEPAAGAANGWIALVHTGDILGGATRLLATLMGLATAGLAGTGLWLWLNARALRRAARQIRPRST